MPIWKAWRIQRDLTTLDRQAILIDSAGKVITLKNAALKASELTQAALDSAYQARTTEAKECRVVNELSGKLHKSELKGERAKGRKEGAIVFGCLGLLLLLLL